MTSAASIGIGTATTDSAGVLEVPSSGVDQRVPKGAAPGISAAETSSASEGLTRWKDLLEDMGLTVQHSTREVGGGTEDRTSVKTARPVKMAGEARDTAAGDFRFDDHGSPTPARLSGLGTLPSRAGAVSGTKAASSDKVLAGHTIKTRKGEDAGAPTSAKLPDAGGELAAASSATAIASPVSSQPQKSVTDGAVPGREPLCIPGAAVQAVEKDARPDGNNIRSNSISIEEPGEDIPTALAASSASSTTRDSATVQAEAAGPGHDALGRSNFAASVAEQAGEIMPGSSSATAVDNSSVAEKHTPVPISAPEAGPTERSTASAVPATAKRSSNPGTESVAGLATPKISTDSGPHVAATGLHESVFPVSVSLRDSGAMAGIAERPVSMPDHIGAANANPFNALDAMHTLPGQAWISAGSHHAEAGYLDPALGWVSVRADAAPNGLHAALIPPSGEAAQVLGTHLQGLNAYLSEHHREPTTITISAPEDGRSEAGMRQGTHAERDDSARDEPAQHPRDSNEKASVSIPPVPHRVSLATLEPMAIRAPGFGGKHISVMV